MFKVGFGRKNMGFGLGPDGYCICPSGGYKEKHSRDFPCYIKTCPKCGRKMTRKR